MEADYKRITGKGHNGIGVNTTIAFDENGAGHMVGTYRHIEIVKFSLHIDEKNSGWLDLESFGAGRAKIYYRDGDYYETKLYPEINHEGEDSHSHEYFDKMKKNIEENKKLVEPYENTGLFAATHQLKNMISVTLDKCDKEKKVVILEPKIFD